MTYVKSKTGGVVPGMDQVNFRRKLYVYSAKIKHSLVLQQC